MSVKTTVEVTVYGVDGEEGSRYPPVLVKTVGECSSMVLITIGGHAYVVDASDMAAAVQKARGR